jgi:hypothetical protein
MTVTEKTMPEEGTIVLGYNRNHMTPMLVYLNWEYPNGWIEATNVDELSPKDVPEYYMHIPNALKLFLAFK